MKAIILASGIGKRLRPLTDTLPKPLLRINEKTILEYQLDHLSACNIKHVVITTGPFEETLKTFVMKRYNDFSFTFVHNPHYASTNYIYSLWLTKDEITDDILLIHGDLLFTQTLLKKIISGTGNRVAVNKKLKPTQKDFKAVIEHNRVRKIGVQFLEKNAFPSLPLYKFLKDDFLIWMHQIEKEITQGKVQIYAEDAFNTISEKIHLKPLYYTDSIPMEIDTIQDLKIAQKLLKS